MADFIEADFHGLIDDWTECALAISRKDSHLSDTKLRNSSAEILTAIAADMRASQDATQKEANSRGDNRGSLSGFDRIARHHADGRLSHGFAFDDVVAEFRAPLPIRAR
nr:RsbRD N-terminal domain-containing protein [Paraburkholderia strydomiana]